MGGGVGVGVGGLRVGCSWRGGGDIKLDRACQFLIFVRVILHGSILFTFGFNMGGGGYVEYHIKIHTPAIHGFF